MGELLLQRFSANEIAKASDFNAHETWEIDNLHTLLSELLAAEAGSPKDVVVRGLVVQQTGTPGMSVQVTVGLGFSQNTRKLAHNYQTSAALSITVADPTNPRIDTVEGVFSTTDFDQQQRAFKDPATGDISYNMFNVSQRQGIAFNVIAGTPAGSPTAPNTTTGRVKLAEVYVAAAVTQILDASIRNITGYYTGETTALWTTETDRTFKLKSALDQKTIFRAKHAESGDHNNDVIRDAHLDWGTGAGQVDADTMPLGTGITEPAGSGGTAFALTSADFVRAAIQKLVDHLGTMVGVHDDKVLSRHIADLQVLEAHIGSLAVTNGKIGALAVTNGKIADDSVNDPKVDWGVGANQVDSDVMPRGTLKVAPWGTQAAADMVRACLDDIIDHCSVYQ